MKSSIIIFLMLALSVCYSGCARAQAETPEPAPAPAAVYKAGRGLQFAPAATQLFAIQTGEVSTRDFATAKGAAAIPTEALLRTVKGDFVYVANGGWFLRTPVTVGAADGTWVEVKEGLYEGDSIVTHGTRALWLAELQAVNGGVGCADGH